ncbi:MAG: hypothetical protein ACE5JL_01085 [Dehalococcoidia bacterium]
MRSQSVGSVPFQLQNLRGIGRAAPDLYVERVQPLLLGEGIRGDALGLLCDLLQKPGAQAYIHSPHAHVSGNLGKQLSRLLLHRLLGILMRLVQLSHDSLPSIFDYSMWGFKRCPHQPPC